MKVSRTPKGRVKIVLNQSEAEKLSFILNHTSVDWLATESCNSLAADAAEDLALELWEELTSNGVS
jgi:hypothetical protein